MTEAYRLHSSRYLGNSGKGSAVRGARWNPKGTEVIYAAGSRPLAVLEILVHYSVLPRNFVMTQISIPDGFSIIDVLDTALTPRLGSANPNTCNSGIRQRVDRQWLFCGP